MNKPIRILHVVQRMEAGGTQALLMNIYRNIDRTKVQFDFLVEYPNKEFYDDEILKLGGKIYYSTVRTDFNILKFKNQLKNILRENPDYKIMHVHVSNIGYICFKIAKKMGVHTRIAHAHNNGSVHDAKYFLRWILRKLFALYATEYYACSKEAGEYFFKGKDYKVLKNAIDSKKFVYNEKQRIEMRKELKVENNFVVGHIGRFHPQKNHKFLIEIFEKIKEKRSNAKMILVGTGPLEKEIENKVKNLNLEKDVIFLKNRKDINKIYQAMDVFIFPSLFEGLGIVAIEAQASGTPIICSDRLPPEIEISPIYKKTSLDESAEVWANEAIKLADENRNKQNLQQNVKESGFDLCDVVDKLQNFYLQTYEKNMEIEYEN